MTERKAKFLGVVKNRNPFNRRAWEWADLAYEYRGHTYIITKYNNGCSGTDCSLAYQHKQEQAAIDRMIEEANRPKPEWKYEGSGQEGFDMFWDYVNS